MMSPEKTGPKGPKPSKKDETQTSGNRKNSSCRSPDQPINCPRCDSPNTKFCYYNNYSLTQPRHFCKTCRRYWTKGGALRNVPIGGGCRKNKKLKPSGELSGDPQNSGSLNFLNGFPPAMDFQLSRLHSSISNSVSYNQFSSLGDNQDLSNLTNLLSKPKFNLDPLDNLGPSSMGFDFPLMGSLNVNNNLASSIESLSSINQDLHLKLQQRRLSLVLGGGNIGVENGNGENNGNDEKGQPIVFENLEIRKQSGSGSGSGSGNLETEWYFDNCYGAMNSNGRGNESGSNWSGVQAWSNGSNLNNCFP